MTFYAFPKEHWKHLRTTNVVESPFAAVRLRTAAAKRFKKVENATAIIWKTLLVAEQSFRRLDAPERLPEVAESVVYVDGVGRSGATRRPPPDLVYTRLDKTSE
ncbi:MAG TPA: transposase [Methylomirabilota bacterium]|nr:transposase [Methylomirabilota bacterium]